MNLSVIREKWEALTKNQRTILIVMTVAVLLSAVFFVQWFTKVEYAELFTGMEPNAAGEVVARLQEMGLPYKLANQGTAILVPANQVYDLRLQLAASGVFASGGTGFELFDQSKLGITDFERQLNYQRALQEELRRTIIQLEAVEQARVHLVIPEQSLFIKEQGQATASIVVKLAPMSSLRPDQVMAIINLVAGSVDKLDPKNVHVIDTQGVILSEGLFDDGGGIIVSQGKQFEQKRKFEKDLEQRVQALLQQMLGSGKSVTMVNADLDYDHREVTRIEFGQSHIRSEQTIDEQHVNRTQGGVVGQDNLQDLGTIYPELESGDSGSSISERITNYELDQLQETVVYAPGRLVSLSTAVAIDGTLTDEMVESIRQVVAAAIGFNPERGDQIAVMSMEFDKRALQESEAQMAMMALQEKKEEQIKIYISWGFKALAIILGFILLLIIIRSLGEAFKREPVMERPIPIAQMEEEIEPPKPKDEAVKKQEKVQKVAKEKPEETAALLKQWLMED
ncbi:flagellar basal-body MS-ring/collar protein FliF [Desulfitibacter alkalitolerans]|uniref:flagellar basal-body MS-ring/collar protein FliF n=1 Tax=Desulfitibacter alkalitolerans TaxID=264641 RepID=UPI000483AE09|nr:flagellar basal-body MS-ring/collar protein FliF [Desulfitibacter alkalitolerans]